jgi:N-acetylglutamate synthase-like GNAT family acetyltransferase
LVPRIEYRKGALRDLRDLRFEDGLSVSVESIEFNVLGMGHEFWLAVQSDAIIGVAVLSQENHDSFKILHLEVAPSRKKEGVGSSLLKAVMGARSQCDFSVVPAGETEAFYSHLGFVHAGRWEMRRSSLSKHKAR